MSLTAAALLGSGVISTAGQLYANQQNLANTNAWNDVQVDLANTAHQREVLDLQAAGLNPVLSASSSGSATPSLGAATVSNPGEGLSSGISSATKAARIEEPLKQSQALVNVATAKNLDVQNRNLKAQTDQIKATTNKIKAETKLPGKLGSAYRTASSVGQSAVSAVKDISSNAWQVATDLLRPSNPTPSSMNSASSVGTVRATDARAPMSPRMRHETSTYINNKPKRKHN